MAGDRPHLAVDNTADPEEAAPSDGNGGNGTRLRSDFHQLELSMERLRADVVSEVSSAKVGDARLETKIAEAKVTIIVAILIMMGAATTIAVAVTTWKPWEATISVEEVLPSVPKEAPAATSQTEPASTTPAEDGG